LFSSLREHFDIWKSSREGRKFSLEQFSERFAENFHTCEWEPHALYSVFTQYDQEYYLARKDDFMRKYRSFYAVSKTISPRRIIELGASAGASADAYLSAAPSAQYWGLDTFGASSHHADGSWWDPYEVAVKLFNDRGFKKWELVRGNLRALKKLPALADLVVVDAAHDFENEYADLKLALTANPRFIFIDDSDDENEAKPAIEKFLQDDLKDRVDYTFHVDYTGGGLVIKLRRLNPAQKYLKQTVGWFPRP
jgi:predicted O-methyltransferase YrrM